MFSSVRELLDGEVGLLQVFGEPVRLDARQHAPWVRFQVRLLSHEDVRHVHDEQRNVLRDGALAIAILLDCHTV